VVVIVIVVVVVVVVVIMVVIPIVVVIPIMVVIPIVVVIPVMVMIPIMVVISVMIMIPIPVMVMIAVMSLPPIAVVMAVAPTVIPLEAATFAPYPTATERMMAAPAAVTLVTPIVSVGQGRRRSCGNQSEPQQGACKLHSDGCHGPYFQWTFCTARAAVSGSPIRVADQRRKIADVPVRAPKRIQIRERRGHCRHCRHRPPVPARATAQRRCCSS
jgi:hypothetical protein